jgi:hypothetical protein
MSKLKNFARVGDLTADQQQRQRELGLGDQRNQKGFRPRVASLLKGIRNQIKKGK